MLQALVLLDLSANQLTGSLPSNWSDSWSSLKFLYLSYNNLSGNLPAAWADMPALMMADISANPGLKAAIVPRAWMRNYCRKEGLFVCTHRTSTAHRGGCGSYIYGSSDHHLDVHNLCDHGNAVAAVAAIWVVFLLIMLLMWLHSWRQITLTRRATSGSLVQALLDDAEAAYIAATSAAGSTAAITSGQPQCGSGEAGPSNLRGMTNGHIHTATMSRSHSLNRSQSLGNRSRSLTPTPHSLSPRPPLAPKADAPNWFEPSILLPLGVLIADVVTDGRLVMLWGWGHDVKYWPSFALMCFMLLPHIAVGIVVHFRLLAVASLPPVLKAASPAMLPTTHHPPGATALIGFYGWLMQAPCCIAYPALLVLLIPSVLLLTIICPSTLLLHMVGLVSHDTAVRYLQLLQGCVAVTEAPASAVLMTVIYFMGNIPNDLAYLDGPLFFVTLLCSLADMLTAWSVRLNSSRLSYAQQLPWWS